MENPRLQSTLYIPWWSLQANQKISSVSRTLYKPALHIQGIHFAESNVPTIRTSICVPPTRQNKMNTRSMRHLNCVRSVGRQTACGEEWNNAHSTQRRKERSQVWFWVLHAHCRSEGQWHELTHWVSEPRKRSGHMLALYSSIRENPPV